MNNLTDEQLSVLSIFLQIEVCVLYNMSLPLIAVKARKAAKVMGKDINGAFIKTGAYRMLYAPQRQQADELAKILEKA